MPLPTSSRPLPGYQISTLNGAPIPGSLPSWQDAVVKQMVKNLNSKDPQYNGQPAGWDPAKYGDWSSMQQVGASGTVPISTVTRLYQYMQSDGASDPWAIQNYGPPPPPSPGDYTLSPEAATQDLATRRADQTDAQLAFDQQKFAIQLAMDQRSGGGSSGGGIGSRVSAGGSGGGGGGGSSGYADAAALAQLNHSLQMQALQEQWSHDAIQQGVDNAFREKQLAQSAAQFNQQMAYQQQKDAADLAQKRGDTIAKIGSDPGNSVYRQFLLHPGSDAANVQEPTGTKTDVFTGATTPGQTTLSQIMRDNAPIVSGYIQPGMAGLPAAPATGATATGTPIAPSATVSALPPPIVPPAGTIVPPPGTPAMAVGSDGWTDDPQFIAGDSLDGRPNEELVQLGTKGGKPVAKVTPLSQMVKGMPKYADGTNPNAPPQGPGNGFNSQAPVGPGFGGPGAPTQPAQPPINHPPARIPGDGGGTPGVGTWNDGSMPSGPELPDWIKNAHLTPGANGALPASFGPPPNLGGDGPPPMKTMPIVAGPGFMPGPPDAPGTPPAQGGWLDGSPPMHTMPIDVAPQPYRPMPPPPNLGGDGPPPAGGWAPYGGPPQWANAGSAPPMHTMPISGYLQPRPGQPPWWRMPHFAEGTGDDPLAWMKSNDQGSIKPPATGNTPVVPPPATTAPVTTPPATNPVTTTPTAPTTPAPAATTTPPAAVTPPANTGNPNEPPVVVPPPPSNTPTVPAAPPVVPAVDPTAALAAALAHALAPAPTPNPTGTSDPSAPQQSLATLSQMLRPPPAPAQAAPAQPSWWNSLPKFAGGTDPNQPEPTTQTPRPAGSGPPLTTQPIAAQPAIDPGSYPLHAPLIGGPGSNTGGDKGHAYHQGGMWSDDGQNWSAVGEYGPALGMYGFNPSIPPPQSAVAGPSTWDATGTGGPSWEESARFGPGEGESLSDIYNRTHTGFSPLGSEGSITGTDFNGHFWGPLGDTPANVRAAHDAAQAALPTGRVPLSQLGPDTPMGQRGLYTMGSGTIGPSTPPQNVVSGMTQLTPDEVKAMGLDPGSVHYGSHDEYGHVVQVMGLTGAQVSRGVTQSTDPQAPNFVLPNGLVPGVATHPPAGRGDYVGQKKFNGEQDSNLTFTWDGSKWVQDAPLATAGGGPGGVAAIGPANSGGYRPVTGAGTMKTPDGGGTYQLQAGDMIGPDGTILRWYQPVNGVAYENDPATGKPVAVSDPKHPIFQAQYLPVQPAPTIISSMAQFQLLPPATQQAIRAGAASGYLINNKGINTAAGVPGGSAPGLQPGRSYPGGWWTEGRGTVLSPQYIPGVGTSVGGFTTQAPATNPMPGVTRSGAAVWPGQMDQLSPATNYGPARQPLSIPSAQPPATGTSAGATGAPGAAPAAGGAGAPSAPGAPAAGSPAATLSGLLGGAAATGGGTFGTITYDPNTWASQPMMRYLGGSMSEGDYMNIAAKPIEVPALGLIGDKALPAPNGLNYQKLIFLSQNDPDGFAELNEMYRAGGIPLTAIIPMLAARAPRGQVYQPNLIQTESHDFLNNTLPYRTIPTLQA